MSDFRPIIPLGTKVPPYGKVAAVGWCGERYYWLVGAKGQVAMLPANVAEARLDKGASRRDP